MAGQGDVPRPCEPLDIMREVDRLYRSRLLLRDHLHVLVHYGRRQEAPDAQRPREARAAHIWQEAFQHIGPVLSRKGIILPVRVNTMPAVAERVPEQAMAVFSPLSSRSPLPVPAVAQESRRSAAARITAPPPVRRLGRAAGTAFPAAA